MLLAIDTATRTMSVALHDGAELLAEQTWITPNQHNNTLAPALYKLLQDYAVSVAALRGIAVCIGPGSYTGLRIGVSLAKGLAAAHRLPLVGFSTLDVLALSQPNYTGTLLCVAQAGRGRIITAAYRWRKGRWQARDEGTQLSDWHSILDQLDGATFVTGEVGDDGRLLIADAITRGLNVTLVSSALRLRRAGYLAEEALSLLDEHPADDFSPAKVVPIYIKTDAIP